MKKNITNSDYHSHKALGSSAIKLVPQSLAKFKAYIDGELFHETSALKFGQLIHEVILEDGLNTLAVGPDADKRTKVWKDFVAKNDGKQIVTPKEFETLRQMHKSLYDNKNCSLVLKGGEAEQSFFWEHDNIEYKARPDYYVQRDQGDYIVDYKSITGSDFSDIQRTMGKYAYDIQAAHYIRVVSECTGRPVRDYVWIFQEKEAPYESVVVKAPAEMLERAATDWEHIHELIKKAKETGEYPGKYPGIVEIDLPGWAVEKRWGNE